MSRSTKRRKKRPVTITMARNLYVIALQCRAEAVGGGVTDPEYDALPTTHAKTWFLFAQRLVKSGWKPPCKPPEMPNKPSALSQGQVLRQEWRAKP